MDWNGIVLAVIGVIGGIDLYRFFFIKNDKKKKDVENVNAEVETLRSANDILAKQLESANKTISEKDTVIEAKDSLIEEKNRKIAKLSGTVTALFDDMCIHKGCRLRKPHQGQGAMWYEKYQDDPGLGSDYLSIDTLIKQDRVSRNKLNLEGGK